MGILKFTFFCVRQTKSYLVRRQWIGVKFDVMGINLMSWACKGYTSTSEIKKIDFRVKPKVRNDEKP